MMLKLCSVAQPTHLLPPSLPAVPRNDPPQQQRLRRIESEPKLPQRGLAKTPCHAGGGTVAMPSAVIRQDFDYFQAATIYENPLMRSNAVVLTSQARTFVNTAVLLHWKIQACKFMIRAGPVLKLRSNVCLKIQSEKDQPKKRQQIGLGLIFTMYLPQSFRRPLGLALLNFQAMITNRTSQTLHWNLSLPKTVPADAEIFNYTRAGSIHHVQRLITLKRASATDITLYGTTLLHSAARSGHIHLTRLLIREGADINAQDEDGESPLHAAMAKSGNYEIARTLIEHGADLCSRAVDGKTPFHNIFNDTIGSVLMRDEWLEHMHPDAEGMSISHYLAWSSRSAPQTFQRGRLCDEAELLAVDALGRNCLHFAAARGNLGVLAYLVSRVGVDDLEKRDVNGRTPLHYAGRSSREAGVIEILMGQRRKQEEIIPAFDLDDKRESTEEYQAKASTLCTYMRGLTSFSEVFIELLNTVPHGRGYTSQEIGVATATLFILIIMILLGVPD